MPMTRDQKVRKVKELETTFREAKSAYLADLSGMTVELATKLRDRCRAEGIRVEVAKNTLLRRAAEGTGNEAILPRLTGPTALVTSDTDEVAPARILVGFQKEFKFPGLKGGLLDGRDLSEEDVKAISSLPTKDVLLGQLARTLQSPLSNLASAITSPLRDLVGVLNALAEKKETA